MEVARAMIERIELRCDQLIQVTTKSVSWGSVNLISWREMNLDYSAIFARIQLL